ncbi:MAG: TRAP transporter small permease subunit [Pseudomonadota bacterium]
MADLFLAIGTGLQWLGILLSPVLVLPLAILLWPTQPSARFSSLHRLLDTISGGAQRLAMLAAVIMVLAQLAVVIVRHVYGLAFSWLDETVIYAFASVFLLGAAGALREDAHVRVDILRGRFSARRRAVIELFGIYVFVFPIGILVLWAVEPSLSRSWAGFEGSRESDGLPIYYLFRSLIPAFGILLILQGLGNALKMALGLRGLDTLPTMTGDGPAEAL